MKILSLKLTVAIGLFLSVFGTSGLVLGLKPTDVAAHFRT